MSTAHLLIVDDDAGLRELLEEYLQPLGYRLSLASDGEAGLRMASEDPSIDLILLDVMLPKLDGFEVLKKLRQTLLTPVLMLTAKGDDFDRIFGLELGADDYLPKPFNPRELAARIKAMLRRAQYQQQEQQNQSLLVGALRLNAQTMQALCHEQALTLTATEFALLQLLMQRAGQLVSKQDISQQVLGRRLMAFDRSIDMHVSNLRRKLTAAGAGDLLTTVRGSGYQLTVTP